MAKKKKTANKKGRVNKKELDKVLAKYGENPNARKDFTTMED